MRTETEKRAIWESSGGLAIKLNSRPFNGPCGICEDMAGFAVGLEVVLGDCNAVVCRNCTRRYEPELAKLLAGEPDYYGECPTCWHNDGCRSVGKTHFFLCHVHRVCWNIGYNLFSPPSWMDDTKEDWQENIELLQGYTVIEEFHGPGSIQNKPVAVGALVGPDDIPF